MCIERNRYLLFWTAPGLQIVLPNPTTPALTREAGLVHGVLTPPRASASTAATIENLASGNHLQRAVFAAQELMGFGNPDTGQY